MSDDSFIPDFNDDGTVKEQGSATSSTASTLRIRFVGDHGAFDEGFSRETPRAVAEELLRSDMWVLADATPEDIAAKHEAAAQAAASAPAQGG